MKELGVASYREVWYEVKQRQMCICSVRSDILGHLITTDGIKADPEKVKAVKHMPLPESKEDLQRFLGIANYLCKFVPNFSENTRLLRKLLEKDVLWRFEEEHKKSVEDLKTVISSSPILQFYDPQLQTRLTTDASKNGLGAILEQNHEEKWKPVAFSSREPLPQRKDIAKLKKKH